MYELKFRSSENVFRSSIAIDLILYEAVEILKQVKYCQHVDEAIFHRPTCQLRFVHFVDFLIIVLNN